MGNRLEAVANPAAEPPAARHEADGLIDDLDALRELMLEVETRLLPRLGELDPAAMASARNLAHWLASRAFDPRRLHKPLASLGLAPPRPDDPQALATLDSTLSLLHLLAGRAMSAPGRPKGEYRSAQHEGTPVSPPGRPKGEYRSAQHEGTPIGASSPPRGAALPGARPRRAEALFGAPPGGRRATIMVTLPHAMAVDDAFVRDLVLGGMDVARIDCAHATPGAWAALAAQVRRVAAANGRAVKVLMELAGPRLRTGPIAAGPAVLKLKPARDALGSVVSPVRLGLRAQGALAAVPGATAHVGVAADWLAALEIAERIDFVDARGTARRLTVLGRCDHGVLVEGTRTLYLTPETGFRVHRRGEDTRETMLFDLPAAEGRLLLRRGDTLRLVRQGQGHDASDGSARRRVAVATVACTVPEALDALHKAERVWFDRARIGGIVRRATAKGVEIEITDADEDGSWLGGDKRIDLPDTRLDLPAVTPRDADALAVVARHADLVGLSFAQGAADVKRLRRHLNRLGADDIGIVLRLETQCGFEHLPQLLFAALACRAAAVLVGRDDLALACGFARVGERQAEVLSACEAAQIPLVWAMQGTGSRGGPAALAEAAGAAREVGAACVVLDKAPRLLDALRVLNSTLDSECAGALGGEPGSALARPRPPRAKPTPPDAVRTLT